MQRTVQLEILDHLPACNIDAIASRRDLVKINCLMGNFRWMRSAIKSERNRAALRYLEIGAGDGHLGQRLIRSASIEHYDAIDLSSRPNSWPQSAQWFARDLLSFDGYGDYTHIVANLILHHFESVQLAELGESIQRSGVRCILANEPCRRALHKYQLRAGKLIGFNYVTLNDGCVSIDAGFRGDELPELLGLSREQWTWQISETLMGAYRMRAERR